MNCELEHNIFNMEGGDPMSLSLEVFRYQYRHNSVYRAYVEALGIIPEFVGAVEQIPFMPIRFFKSHKVITGDFEAGLYFESSGTTGTVPSRHFLRDTGLYKTSFVKGFELQYGSANKHAILGLLPSYLERRHSSLVYMVEQLIKLSGHPASGFYLYDHQQLYSTILQLITSAQPFILIGVTFALLDFAKEFPFPITNGIIIETGGMKGRKEELTREAVHETLKNAWQVNTIHSEYGMTELLSQAWSKQKGIFSCPPWMRVLIRDEDDPFLVKKAGRGIINVIDLANLYSCSFIETEDLGLLHSNGTFEVIGRVDSSEARGCSMMVTNI
jgi:hypothetical protein